MAFEEWHKTVPDNLRQDPLWQFNVYPKTAYLYDRVWDDCALLMKDVRGRAIVDQLIRSGGSLCANIEEGFGRGFGAEFAYFLRVAIGSARETRGWYDRARRLLQAELLQQRLGLLDEIKGALVRAANHQKQQARRRH